MKKNYIVTPQLMDKFNVNDSTPWVTERADFTGFKFLSKINERFFSCSCGAQGTIRYDTVCCPQCGGKLFDGFHIRKTLDGSCARNTWEVREVAFGHWEFYFHKRQLSLKPTGKYDFSDIADKCGEFALPYSFKLDNYVGTNLRARLFNYLKNIPEFCMLCTLGKWKSNTMKGMRVISLNDYLKLLGEEMDNSGLTMAQMDENLSLYGIYFAHRVKGTTHENSLYDFLLSQGLKKNGIAFIMKLFRNKREANYVMTLFVNDEVRFKKFCERIQGCLDESYPNGGFILELLSREVMDISDFIEIMDFFSSMEKEEKVWDNLTKTWMPTSKKMIPDFADFLKKTSSRKQNVVSAFKKRVLKLQKLGYPVILDNLLDKGYYRLLNSSAYSSSSKDFDEEFKRDPLQCLKSMK